MGIVRHREIRAAHCSTCLVIAWLCVIAPAHAQSQSTSAAATFGPPVAASPRRGSDPVWEGMLIGGAAGAVGGMVLAPRMMCGEDDECAAIVRVAVGLPLVVGGLVGGALIDHFSQQGPSVWRSRSGRRVARVDPLLRRAGTGIQVSIRFR